MSDLGKKEKRRSERLLLETEVRLYSEDDIYIARSVDISDTGIRIITERSVEVRIQIKEDDKLVQYNAQLVWARVKDDNTMEYGLKY